MVGGRFNMVGLIAKGMMRIEINLCYNSYKWIEHCMKSCYNSIEYCPNEIVASDP